MRLSVLAFLAGAAILLRGQSSPQQIGAVLSQSIQSPDVVEFQIRRYLSQRVTTPALPATAGEWTAESKRLRSHLLNDVVFHGWPKELVSAPLKFEDLGFIESGKGYRMRKIRYEIVPGFSTTAISYEPATLNGKVPAVLNVHGHGSPGKAFEFKQKRCINYALRGMIAFSPEWLGFGELSAETNHHDYGAHLELAGVNAAGLFYLAMRKGLDYLYDHPNVDRSRIAVTGLSGGGWQTIALSALDERVTLSMPVAGYEPLDVNIVHPNDTAEPEQEPSDFMDGQDYTHLTAMLAPRPALLMFNAEDNCCYRAPMVKEGLYDRIMPFYALYGKSGSFAWHENLDPGTHNYQLDNREQSYRFLAKHFNLSGLDREIPVDADVKSVEELTVGLPKDNLTILDVARRFAGAIQREKLPADDARAKLRSVIRYKAATVAQAWMVGNTKNKGVETRSFQLQFDNGLSAAAVWVKSIAAPENAPLTIATSDQGRKGLSADVSERVDRGEQVLALDLLFTGDSKPQRPAPFAWALLFSSTGDRPLGLEAAQLIGATRWIGGKSGLRSARIEAVGMRSQVASMIAAAMAPALYTDVVVRQGIPSLGVLLSAPVKFRDAPDLFCLDLYRYFDLDSIAQLGAPARFTQRYK
jgi:hypothetical protein